MYKWSGRESFDPKKKSHNKQKGLASLFYKGIYITSTKVKLLICISAIVIHSDMSSCCKILDIIYTLLNLY